MDPQQTVVMGEHRETSFRLRLDGYFVEQRQLEDAAGNGSRIAQVRTTVNMPACITPWDLIISMHDPIFSSPLRLLDHVLMVDRATLRSLKEPKNASRPY